MLFTNGGKLQKLFSSAKSLILKVAPQSTSLDVKVTYLNLSAQLILLGQEGNVSREPFARIFPSKIVRDRRELIDLIRSTGFDDRWPWAAEWQKFSNFLLFFCLFTGY